MKLTMRLPSPLVLYASLIFALLMMLGPVYAYQPTQRDVRISIDAGHGGKDPGSSAYHRHEKTAVLAIAKRLALLLNRKPHFHASLTRRGDYFLSLRHRLNIARAQKADLMLAIHADADLNPQAHGVSLFTLSSQGATSEAARWLAEKENHAEMLGGAKLKKQEPILRSVLIDLQQNATIKTSLAIAERLRPSLIRVAHMHQKHVEQAAFVVLKSPDIPSILVETGFLSNPYEGKRLSDPVYQQRLACAIAKGLVDYYSKHPMFNKPENRYARIRMHRVQPKETLFSIARQYRVSPNLLAQSNHLDRDVHLQKGQQLRIPSSDEQHHSLMHWIAN
jgi:N-acetylmuramoyl-L-alanine amidase